MHANTPSQERLPVTGPFDLVPDARFDIVGNPADVHAEVVVHDRCGRSFAGYVDGVLV